IALDGVDLRRLDVQELRRTMAFVPQSPILLDDTVALNIEIGRPGANMEAVVEAAELAGAGELMHQLPAGLDTRVGERGIQLSGGQLQRLAIARALLHGGRVLLLDEPTSAVDGAIEASLHTTLRRLARDRTVLIAAHRPSTVLLASRIAVLDSGRIVAEGSHQKLLEDCVPYRRLWRVEDSKHAGRQTGVGHSPLRSLEKVG
ncbi:MAG: ATP-binding cassette domain-containing protein, partial [bacterium]|nr:ATP-binding cassette domain-containing protein [bacterium]